MLRNLATIREDGAVKDSNEQLDRQIIDNILNGDKNAYNLLVVKYQYKILNVVGKYIYEPADREDIAQQAFIKAYEALPAFRGDSEFYTWLYRIAVNCAKNFLKNKAQNTLTVDVSDPEIESYEGSNKLHDLSNPENLLSSEELKLQLLQALDALPGELRTAIVMCEMENMSYEQIAEKMNCPIGTVRSRISRAREALDKVIKPFLDN